MVGTPLPAPGWAGVAVPGKTGVGRAARAESAGLVHHQKQQASSLLLLTNAIVITVIFSSVFCLYQINN